MTWLENTLGETRDCPLGGKCNDKLCKSGCYDIDAANKLANLKVSSVYIARAYESAIGHLSVFRQKRIIDRIRTISQLNQTYNNTKK